MVDRIQLNVQAYMQLDGQWQIVEPGSVLDVPDGTKFHSSVATPVVETAGTLPAHGKPVRVRNVRTR